MKKRTEYSSCDWKSPAKKKSHQNTDRILKHKGNCKWSGVKTETYKKTDEKSWAKIARSVLIGNCGETAKFHVRYFEIAPSGYSSLETHKHEHVVICIRGKGKARIGKKLKQVDYLDTLYIAPNTVHQLSNPFDEPFGFLCIVNAKRDKPKIVKE